MKALHSPRSALTAILVVLAALGACAGTEAQDDGVQDPVVIQGVPLRAGLDLGGEPSAIAVADIDNDGFLDIAALTVAPSSLQIALVIGWGDLDGKWTDRFETTLGTAPSSATRDTTSHAVAIGDWNGDGALDVATSNGVALGDRSHASRRNLTWTPLPGAGAGLLLPVALVDLDDTGELQLVRGTDAGNLERCKAPSSCVAFPVAGAPDPQYDIGLDDFVVGDFDRDGRPDILGGRAEEDRVHSFLWASTADYRPIQNDIHAVDYEVGDVNGDGFADVVAQQNEFISDFPSNTEVWLNTPRGLEKAQTFMNHDNHNDAASLADIDGDGCPDYLMIGVDIPSIGVLRGDCRFLGPHDPNGSVDVGGQEQIPSVDRQLGVQCLDVNGDAQCEAVVRQAAGALHFFAIPERF